MSNNMKMTLEDLMKKVYALIEELNPDSELLTDDPDISAKTYAVINQVMFELARFKKIPRYEEMPVTEGQVVRFEDVAAICGRELYQISNITGARFVPRANGTVLKIQEDGVLEIDFFVYPVRIEEDTDPKEYTFDLSADALEILPYGVAADLLKSDVSAAYGKVYAERYEMMLQRLDSRYSIGGIRMEGGYDV